MPVFKTFFILFLAVLGLRCCAGFSLVAASRGHSPVAVRGLLIVVASLVAEHELYQGQVGVVVAARGLGSMWHMGSVIMTPDQGSNHVSCFCR